MRRQGATAFGPIWGLNPFPPASLLDAAGLPLPLTLPLGFGALPPTPIDFAENVNLANLSFLTAYPTATFGISLFDLLTAGDIWGGHELSLQQRSLSQDLPLIKIDITLR